MYKKWSKTVRCNNDIIIGCRYYSSYYYYYCFSVYVLWPYRMSMLFNSTNNKLIVYISISIIIIIIMSIFQRCKIEWIFLCFGLAKPSERYDLLTVESTVVGWLGFSIIT